MMLDLDKFHPFAYLLIHEVRIFFANVSVVRIKSETDKLVFIHHIHKMVNGILTQLHTLKGQIL